MPTRAPDFRWYPAGSLGFSFSDNDAKIIFGVDEHGDSSTTYEQVGIVVTHRTLKLLGSLIQTTIDHYEEATGNIIPLDPNKVEEFKRRLNQKNPSPTAS